MQKLVELLARMWGAGVGEVVGEAVGTEAIDDAVVGTKSLPSIIKTRVFYNKALHCKST